MTRTTARVRHLESFGPPTVKISVATATGYKHLVAVLSAITPSGSEIVVSDGGTDTQASGKNPRTVTIKLQNEDHLDPGRLAAASHRRRTLDGSEHRQSCLPDPRSRRVGRPHREGDIDAACSAKTRVPLIAHIAAAAIALGAPAATPASHRTRSRSAGRSRSAAPPRHMARSPGRHRTSNTSTRRAASSAARSTTSTSTTSSTSRRRSR